MYSNPDGSEFSMVFQFEHINLDQQEGKEKWDLAPLDFIQLKEILNKWQVELYGKGWNSLFWDNHDLPRIVSRWGNDGKYRIESAKMLATILHGMQGTPYIYQGEELGMTNVKYKIEEYNDVETLNMYHERLEKGYSKEAIMESIYAKGRDNARTPMQWDDSLNAGFTTGKPWLKVNPNYVDIHVEKQINDSNSIFNYYRQLIQLRKEHQVIIDGTFTMYLKEDPNIFAYKREDEQEALIFVCNFYENEVDFTLDKEVEGYELILSNYMDCGSKLKPYEARVYLTK